MGPGRAPQNLTAAVDGELYYPTAVEYSTLHRPFPTEAILESRDVKNPGFALIDLQTSSVTQISSPVADAEYLAGSEMLNGVAARGDDYAGQAMAL